MEWVYAVAIVIVVLIIGLMFFFFMPKPTVFYKSYTNTINNFKDRHEEIKKEILTRDTASSIIPIYGDSAVKSDKYPVTYELLRTMPYVRYAGIINLKAKFEQASEYGYDKIANHTCRYFYAVNISGIKKSGIWIDGEKRFFKESGYICGDMSREHRLFNKDKSRTTTLIFIDIDRHPTIHVGRSPNSDLKKDEVLNICYNSPNILLNQNEPDEDPDVDDEQEEDSEDPDEPEEEPNVEQKEEKEEGLED